MSFGTSGGNGGRPGMMSDINVTPLVDVMLVLLIIFMVTAPMMIQGLDVNLPNVKDAPPLPTEQKQTVLTIQADGTASLDEITVADPSRLAYQVQGVMEANGSKTLFLKADQATPYGTVAAIMGQLRQAGITSIGLVTEPADQAGVQPPAQGAAAQSAPAPRTAGQAAPPTAPRRPAGAN
ncbi:MAG: ExbD/TolR family protein [Candidatus Adiutrix sp.]|jgi:biopolymer transport protein TolR|nr:ExbD/TolR family protein [Candidatus Adiutrix sp.]